EKKHKVMSVKTVFLLLAIFFSLNAYGQINIPLLHQLVEDSKSEHKKQSEAKENQAKNAINEEVNKNMLNQVKDRYKVVQQRFAKDRKSTRLNSSHVKISYAVFCL